MVLLTSLSAPLSNVVRYPPIIENNALFFLLLVTIFLAAFTVLVNENLNNAKIDRYWLITALCVGPLVGYTAWSFYTAKPPTSYFIIDATNDMTPFFNDVQTTVTQVASSATQEKHGLALRIYGGLILGSDASNTRNCYSNTNLLLPPNFYENAIEEVNNSLDPVMPESSGSLLVSINEALNKDLTNYDKPVTLIVITSGMYSECSPAPRSSYLNDTIESIHATDHRIGLRILILSISSLTLRSFDLLDGYANSFGACFVNINISTPAILTAIIYANSSYCSNYPINRPTPTLTP